MMGIGTGEMILILVVALVVMGPQKFPEFAKMLLRTIRDIRSYVSDVQTDITNELKPIQRELNDVTRQIVSEPEASKTIKEETPAISETLESSSVDETALPQDEGKDPYSG